MEFPKKLAKIREQRRLSQGDLAAAVGLHQSRISKWENGEGEPSMTQAARLARALEVPLDFLADDDLDEPPQPVSKEEMVLVRSYRLQRDLPVEVAIENMRRTPGTGFVADDPAVSGRDQRPDLRRSRGS